LSEGGRTIVRVGGRREKAKEGKEKQNLSRRIRRGEWRGIEGGIKFLTGRASGEKEAKGG